MVTGEMSTLIGNCAVEQLVRGALGTITVITAGRLYENHREDKSEEQKSNYSGEIFKEYREKIKEEITQKLYKKKLMSLIIK